MLQVSVDGEPPRPAASVVIFDDNTPVAAAVPQNDVVLWADAARDPEFAGILRGLGLSAPKDVQRYSI